MRSIPTAITKVNCFLAVAAGLLTAAITLIVCADVGSRGLLNLSLPGASEVAVLLLIALVFLGFAGAEAKGENFTVTILLQALSLRWQRILKVVASFISLATIGLLAWFSWSRGIASTFAFEVTYGSIVFPVWPSKLLIALGLTMLALQLIAGLLDGRDDEEERPHD